MAIASKALHQSKQNWGSGTTSSTGSKHHCFLTQPQGRIQDLLFGGVDPGAKF